MADAASVRRLALAITLEKAVDAAMPPRPAGSGAPSSSLSAPAHVAPSPVQTAAQAHLSTGKAATPEFTHAEMTAKDDHEVRQKTADLPTLYGHAAQHKEWMDRVTTARRASLPLGLHVVEGRKPRRRLRRGAPAAGW